MTSASLAGLTSLTWPYSRQPGNWPVNQLFGKLSPTVLLICTRNQPVYPTFNRYCVPSSENARAPVFSAGNRGHEDRWTTSPFRSTTDGIVGADRVRKVRLFALFCALLRSRNPLKPVTMGFPKQFPSWTSRVRFPSPAPI